MKSGVGRLVEAAHARGEAADCGADGTDRRYKKWESPR
jgi:hypothetical protein